MRAPWSLRTLALFALLALATGCLHRRPKVEGFEAKVGKQDVTLMKETLAGATARYTAQVAGPTGARIDRASWEVRYADQVVSRGETPLSLAFGKDGLTPVTLVVPVPYAQTAHDLARLQDGKKAKLELKGTLHFSRAGRTGRVPFGTDKKVPSPRAPEAKVADVQGARFNTGESEVTLLLEVKNPNGFPIQLTEVPYAVRLASARPSEGVALPGEIIPPEGVARYPVRAYLDPPSEDPDDWVRRTKVSYSLQGAIRGALFDVRFAFDGTVKLRAGR
jgi:LEA14-like dessication related protein